MSDAPFDQKVKDFLKRTQADLERATRDLKEEGQRLLREVQDPGTQAKVRAGLQDLSVWARKAAEDVADLAEAGVKKAEGAIKVASERVKDFTTKPPPGPASPPASRGDDAPDDDERAATAEAHAAPRPAKKSIGKKPAARSAGTPKKKAAKKPLGKNDAE